jgi:hypoxanthine phosphoribosyltransferase
MTDIKYSWDALTKDSKLLCDRIIESQFKPELIIGITRGGAIPAVIASHYLKLPVTFIEWSTRDSHVKDRGVILNLVAQIQYQNIKVMIIDDIVDSGKTYGELQDILSGMHTNIMYCSLYFNPSQKNAFVDFSVNEIDREFDARWVVFPFEE